MRKVCDTSVFAELFGTFESTAFRLESRDAYVEPIEDEALRLFLAGTPDYAWFQEWAASVRRWTQEGKRIERVRVVSVPHSDYTRFGLDLAAHNTEAGEDIRYLDRDRANQLELPDEDYWLFDCRTAAILRFAEDGRLDSLLVTDEPEDVRLRLARQRAAWPHATPWQEYVKTAE